MATTRPAPTPLKRKVGLDQPCRLCDQEIYFGYKGPVEGVCGRCVDRLRSSLNGRGAGQKVVYRGVQRPMGRVGVMFGLFIFGAIVGFLVHHFVPHLPF